MILCPLPCPLFALLAICEPISTTSVPRLKKRAAHFHDEERKASLVVIDCVAYEEQRQHERYVQKLREAEIEEKYRKETISQASLDETMERIFEVWGV